LGEIPQNTHRNKRVVYKMWKVSYKLYWTLTFWKVWFSNSFLYLLCFFLKKPLFLKGRRKKNLFGLYLGEGTENRPFKKIDLFPWATGLRLRSQIWKGLFLDPSPI
jgi:hypothetical protein